MKKNYQNSIALLILIIHVWREDGYQRSYSRYVDELSNVRGTTNTANYQTRYDGETGSNHKNDAFPHPGETLYQMKMAKVFTP